MADIVTSDDGSEKLTPPIPEPLGVPLAAKPEVVQTPEQREKLRATVFEIAMAKRGKGQDKEEAERISNLLADHSIKAAETLGLEIPTEYLSNVHQLLTSINSREGVGITLTDDTTRIIRSAENP